MLGSPVAEEKKRRWRVETRRSKGGKDESLCWDDWSGGGIGKELKVRYGGRICQSNCMWHKTYTVYTSLFQ